MYMRKILLIIPLFVILLCGTAFAQSYQNEPDGFRGILWESILHQLTKPQQGYYVNINSLDAKQQYPEILFYNPSDTMQLGNANIKSLTYYSYQKTDRTPPVLSKVNLYFEGKSNVDNLEKYMSETFGQPTETTEHIKDNNDLGTWDIIVWKGEKTILELSVLRSEIKPNGYATLWIMSNKLIDEIENRRPKAKELQFNNGI